MFSCSVCSSSFTTKNSLKCHKKSVHRDSIVLASGTIIKNEQGLFKCPIHFTTGKTTQFVTSHNECFASAAAFASQMEGSDDAASILGEAFRDGNN